jgi:hypothetical protein
MLRAREGRCGGLVVTLPPVPVVIILRSPAILANLYAGFPAATHQFQLCS